MIKNNEIIFTGGSGLLGKEFKKIIPESRYPSSDEFNVTDFVQMDNYLKQNPCKLLVHAAAVTSPPLVDKNPFKALEVNIVGTANVVKLCARHKLKLIYISTDYVFNGEKGNYRENDPVYPVNKYAWSKLGGECAVRMYDNSIIVRTSFTAKIFPYEKAFTDHWTSRDRVDVIASKIVRLINMDATGVFHVGSKRKSALEYARSLDDKKDIKELSIHDVNFCVPADTSLNCDKYNETMEGNK